MDSLRVGRSLRALRLRANLRQVDVAEKAGVSRPTYTRVEAGELGVVSVAQLQAICAALDATLDMAVRWQGTELDRLLNAGHSALHEEVAGRLVPLGWELASEVTFSVYGERGSIDILAWHAATRTLLIIELKTEIADVQALLAQVDTYVRLAPRVARERGWVADRVATWLAVLESATNRRRFNAHRTVLRASFPDDGNDLRSFLLEPSRPVRVLSFVRAETATQRTAARGSRRRVRARHQRQIAHTSPAGTVTMPAGPETKPAGDTWVDSMLGGGEEGLVDLSGVARENR